jgi:hypothetical protein
MHSKNLFHSILLIVGIIVLSSSPSVTPVKAAQEVFWLSGTVNELSTPIPGVLVSTGQGHSALTDSNGFFKLEGLPAGEYTITASKEHYTFGGAATVRVIFSACCLFIQGYANRYSLNGEIKDNHGMPLPDVTVAAKSGDHETRVFSNSLGHYALVNILFGTYTITLSKENYIFFPNQFQIDLFSDKPGFNLTGIAREELKELLFLPFCIK